MAVMMNFGEALHALRNGYHVARDCWMDKTRYLVLVEGQKAMAEAPTLGVHNGVILLTLPHIDNCNGSAPAKRWGVSQGDILAHDWNVVS